MILGVDKRKSAVHSKPSWVLQTHDPGGGEISITPVLFFPKADFVHLG